MKKSLHVLIYALFFLMLLGLVSSCGKGAGDSSKYSFYESTVDTSKPPAWGSDEDIHILCDTETWKLAENFLRRSLERQVYVVVNEQYFHLIKADIREMDTISKYKNLLFMGDLKSRDAVSQHVRNTIPERMNQRVKNTGAEMFVAKNRWVKDQLIVYMVGSSRENLLRLLISQNNRLFNLFVNRYGERLAYQAYLTKVIPEEFFEPYPFSIKIPQSYRLFSDDKANRFLSFLYRMRSEAREYPDKYISIYYENMPADSLNLDWLIAKRRELAARYYDGDEFEVEKIRSERLSFGTYNAMRLLGPWKNPKHDIGGGFQTFAFYDAAQKRAYLIDNVVYYPAGDKLPQLMELEKISVTFRTK
jgi:hypothetical protein